MLLWKRCTSQYRHPALDIQVSSHGNVGFRVDGRMYLIASMSRHTGNNHHAGSNIRSLMHNLRRCLCTRKSACDVDIKQPLSPVQRKVHRPTTVRDSSACDKAAGSSIRSSPASIIQWPPSVTKGWPFFCKIQICPSVVYPSTRYNFCVNLSCRRLKAYCIILPIHRKHLVESKWEEASRFVRSQALQSEQTTGSLCSCHH